MAVHLRRLEIDVTLASRPARQGMAVRAPRARPVRRPAPRPGRAAGGGPSGSIQLKRTGGGGGAPDGAVQQFIQASRGQGLSGSLQALLEEHFGRELSRVRVHTDPAAAMASRMLGARAFALGDDIYFGPGQFSPGTASGRGLIGHEVAHVVQRWDGLLDGGPAGHGGGLRLGTSSRLEAFAEEHERRLAGLGSARGAGSRFLEVEARGDFGDSRAAVEEIVADAVREAEALLDARPRRAEVARVAVRGAIDLGDRAGTTRRLARQIADQTARALRQQPRAPGAAGLALLSKLYGMPLQRVQEFLLHVQGYGADRLTPHPSGGGAGSTGWTVADLRYYDEAGLRTLLQNRFPRQRIQQLRAAAPKTAAGGAFPEEAPLFFRLMSDVEAQKLIETGAMLSKGMYDTIDTVDPAQRHLVPQFLESDAGLTPQQVQELLAMPPGAARCQRILELIPMERIMELHNQQTFYFDFMDPVKSVSLGPHYTDANQFVALVVDVHGRARRARMEGKADIGDYEGEWVFAGSIQEDEVAAVFTGREFEELVPGALARQLRDARQAAVR